MLTVYALLYKQTLDTALSLEQSELSRNLTRARNAVASELLQLETTTLDWAVFDEAYEYLQGQNPRFAERNLLSNLSILNLEYFIIEKGNSVAVAQKRRTELQYEDTLEDVSNFTNPERWLWRKQQQPLQRFTQLEVKSGFASNNGKIYFIAQAAIVPSSRVSPALGKLTMVRLFNLETLKKLSELTQINIQVQQELSLEPPMLEKSTAIQKLIGGQQNVIYPINDNIIECFTLLSLTTTSGALVLEVRTDRTAFQAAKQYLVRLAWSLALIGFLVTVLIYGLLEFGLLSRLTKLHRQLGIIAKSDDSSIRIETQGTDEISTLAQQINSSLSQVEETQIKSAQLQTRLERLRTIELEANLEATRLELFERLARVAEFRDNDTSLHTSRVGEISSAIASELGLSPDECERIRFAARLHDIGKIAIPDSILLKPSGLEREEWTLMQTHAALGAQMLEGSGSPLLEMARVIALTHHERWNGSGYPLGLHRQEIPLLGRIVAVADTFDALMSHRPYKPAWTREDALGEIESQSNFLFDPQVVEALLKLNPEYYATTHERIAV